MVKREETIQEKALEELNEIEGWRKLEFDITEDYEYVPKSMLFKIMSNTLYYIIAFPILKIVTKIVYDFKIEGKENIRNIKTGAVTISNHVLILDCAMVGLSAGFKGEHFTALAESFKIPFVRKLIKLLKAIPIPTDVDNKKRFFKAVDDLLISGELVHIYPEASLMPYSRKLRDFKNGAFHFSIRNNVPIVPMVFNFRTPKGIRKVFKRKLDVTLKVLKPIYPEEKDLETYKKEVFEIMENNIKKHL